MNKKELLKEYFSAIGNSDGYFTRKKVIILMWIAAIPFLGLLMMMLFLIIAPLIGIQNKSVPNKYKLDYIKKLIDKVQSSTNNVGSVKKE